MQTLSFGMLGYGFMAKAHTHALRTLQYIDPAFDVTLRLVALAGRNGATARAAAEQLGWERATSDWRDLISASDIDAIDNGGPNDAHAEPCIAAARAGKHVICEKPLGRNAAEALAMLEAVQAAGVTHMCAFNYRFVPAVRLARDLVRAGRLGRIRHFRAAYLQEWLADPRVPMSWRLKRAEAGSGALGDLGTHIIDLARFLVGEPASVAAMTATFVEQRPQAGGAIGRVDVDDAFVAAITFADGAIGTLEASRFARGRKNGNRFEINGERGSIAFDLEQLNELWVYLPEEEVGDDASGFRRVSITERSHPFLDLWWPPGHVIGWDATFVHELRHFARAVAGKRGVAPEGADFADGYRACAIADAILESARTGARIPIVYQPTNVKKVEELVR
jgi:predicted dehydrogenase